MGCGVSQQSANDAQLPLNRYIRLQLIANGSHGKVYRAFDNINKFDCAQKVIDKLPQSFNIQTIHTDINQHFNKLKNLQSEKIVKYHNMYIKEGEMTIIMDLTKEGTLHKYIKSKGKLSQSIISKITQQILKGLQYLHDSELLHNDLKPSNVLLFPNQQIKLSDYCIAELFDGRLQVKTVGKQSPMQFKWDNIPYMAPEVVKNIGPSRLSDVWSVGCIVIEMITGKKAWSSLGSQEQIFKKVASGVVPPLPVGISQSCQNFMESCLAIVPSQRSGVEQLLSHPFIIGPKEKVEQYTTPMKGNKQIQNVVNTSTLSIQKQRTQLKQKGKTLKVIQENKSSPLLDNNIARISQNKAEGSGFAKIDNNVITIKQKQKFQPKSGLKTNKEAFQQPSEHIIMLNNKPVKLQHKNYRNLSNPKKIPTQQTQWTSPSRIKIHTVKEHRKNLSNRYQFGQLNLSKQIDQLDELMMNFSAADNSLQNAGEPLPNANSRLRIQTEPSYPHYDTQQEKEYFKKPLKLLKKKIQERRADQQFQKKMKTQARKYSAADQLSKLLQEEVQKSQEDIYYYDGRSNREDFIIDTEVARAERDRYNQIKKFNLLKKQEQRLKWENQLKSGKEMLKMEAPFKYYIK